MPSSSAIGSSRRLPRWTDALARAGLLRSLGDGGRSGSRTLDDQHVLELWALPIYVTAAEDGCVPGSVSLAQLRYRLTCSYEEYLGWLHGCLRRLGHDVQLPARPVATTGVAADVETCRTLLAVHDATHRPTADDPVVNCWLLATAITAESVDTSFGTTIKFPPTCYLWEHQPIMIARLDAALVADRDGWPANTPVRTVGLPAYISPTGQTAHEAGVAADRAVVCSPVWTYDHDRHTLADGPAGQYFLRFLGLEDGKPGYDRFGPVATEHLVADHGPLPDPSAAAVIVVPPARPPRHPDIAEFIEPHRLENPAADTSEHPGRGIRGAQADAARPLPWAMAATTDPFRARAIRRMWALRDVELKRVGDSTPSRLAQRIVDGSLLRPNRAMDFRELALLEHADHQRSPRQLAPWCEPDQHLLTGRPRQEMVQWLDAMGHCTTKQRHVLDGLNYESTIDDVRAVLTDEGFVEVLDSQSSASGHNVFLVCAAEGWLATVRPTSLAGMSRPCPCVTVYFNTAAIDDDMMLSYLPQGGGYARDWQGRNTNVWAGHFTVHLDASDRHRQSSLRVQLAALRAFGQPVTPWLESPSVHVGPDGTPQTEQHRVLTALPDAVHELFGPRLLS